MLIFFILTGKPFSSIKFHSFFCGVVACTVFVTNVGLSVNDAYTVSTVHRKLNKYSTVHYLLHVDVPVART